MENRNILGVDSSRILEKAKIGLWEWDASLQRLVVDNTASAVLTLAQSQLVLFWKDILHYLSSDAIQQLNTFFSNVQTIGQAEYILEISNGSAREKRVIQWKGYASSDHQAICFGIVEDISSVYKKEQQLLSLSQTLQDFHKLAKLGCWEVDYQQGRIFWSEELFRSFGLDPLVDQEPPLEAFMSFIHPEDTAILRTAVQQSLQTGEAYEVEVRQIQKDTSHRWVLVKGRPVYTSDQKIKGLLGINFDIHERKLSEQKLQESRVRLKAIIENTNDSIWSVNNKSEITAFNSVFKTRLLQLCGIEAREGVNLIEAFREKNLDSYSTQYLKIYERAFNGEAFTELDYIVNEEVLICETSTYPIYQENEIIGISIFSKDVTKQKLAEAETEKLRHILQSILDISPSGIMTLRSVRDGEGTIVDFDCILTNKRANEILSITDAELREKPLFELLPAYWSAELIAIYKSVVNTGEPVHMEQNLDLRGENKWFELIAVKLEDGLSVTFHDITLRKRALFALKDQKAVLETFFNNMPFELWAREADGTVILQNQFCIKNWGHLIGKNFLSSNIPQETIEQWKVNSQRALNGEVVSMESEYVIDNTTHFLHEIIAPIWDNGEIKGVLGANIDIGERLQAQRALKESEEKLRALIDLMPDFVCFKDADGCWQIANNYSLQLLGLENIEYRNKKDAELANLSPFYADILLGHERADQQTWASGTINRREETIPLPDGTLLTFDTLRLPVYDDAGNRKGLLVVGRDISATRKVMDDLVVSEERLRLALNAAAMGTWDWNANTDQVIWSGNLEKLLGLSADSSVHTLTEFMDLIYPEDLPFVKQALATTLHNPESKGFYSMQYRIVFADGDMHWVEGQGKLYQDDSGNPERMLGTIKDITQRKNAEAELKKVSERLTSAFENSQSAFYIYDAVLDDNGKCYDFRLVEVNKIGIDMLTISIDEIMDRLMNEASPGIRQIGLFDRYLQVYNTHEPMNIELPVTAVRIKYKWVHINCVRLEKGIFIAIQDISLRKEQEEKLLEALETEKRLNQDLVTREEQLASSEEELRQNLEIQRRLLLEIQQKEANLSALINNTNDIILSIDTHHYLIEFNESFRELVSGELGIEPKKGESLTVFYDWIAFNKMEALVDLALQGTPSLHTSTFTSADGELHYYEDAYYPMFVETGLVMGVSVVKRDITEKKKAELLLEESELKFRLISSVSNDAMWDWDLLADKTLWSTGFSKIFGFDPSSEDYSIQMWESAIHPEDKERVMEKIYAALEDATIQSWEDSYRILNVEGAVAYVLDKGQIIRNEYGKAIRMVGGMQNITQIWEQQNIILKALEKEKCLNEELAAREEELTSNEEELLQVNEQLTLNYKILEEKELFLKRAQSIAKMGSWEHDVRTNTTYGSEELYNIHEIEPAYVPPLNNLLSRFSEEGVQVIKETYQRILTAGTKQDITIKSTTPDKQVKWLRLISYPIYENNELVKIAGITHDITDLKKVEEKLRSSEEKFGKAFDLSPDLIVLVRENDQIIADVNQRVEEMIGYAKEEVIHTYASHFIRWADPEEEKTFFEKYSQYNQAATETRLKKKNDDFFYATVSARQIEIEGEKYSLQVIRDITEKKMADDKITRSEANLNAIINNTDMSIWSIDKNYRVVAQNNVFKKAMKFYNVDAEIGLNALDPTLPSQIVSYWKGLYDLALKGQPIRFEEKIKRLYFEFSLHPITTGREVTGVAVYSRNITDQILKENKIGKNAIELAEANKKMGELKLMALRSIMNPHFIFNSLNSIQYFVAKNDRQNAIQYLSFFSKLIRGVLNSSVKNKISLSDELELLKYYIKLELVRFDNKFDVVFDIDADIDLENIEIPSLLIQPFVENAILHGLYNKEDRGILKIAVQQEEEVLVVEVEDNGIGRDAATKIKQQSFSHQKSMGMMITKERLEIINQEADVSFEIIDLFDAGNPSGTRIKIYVKL